MFPFRLNNSFKKIINTRDIGRFKKVMIEGEKLGFVKSRNIFIPVSRAERLDSA